ncbi:MAG: hypothetical protein A2186_01830 [Candidatus Levybacteria bacterium RIFOXYA1_FULL_41_10]|uniref:Integral membrane protein n=1 Tax=Candidatus Gottesmanbacteria bacterium GW2011_GWB1_44_11c TaxID=1618447 RepID=A0A0G1GT01_9BACT|nr:MAG: hypothetical protein UU15_C0045G0002 [Candidatus Levybacteria bacterium GW2011_GWC2_40_7]KKR95180.1 MAG: hypothetical protein UU45_C0004G0083 [Candidatus Levybacteria bacterium GW2011_GWA2_41_15]KKT37720.1 MAG: hypothetical protein UW22_C0019G0011 [Candidatus Gottesmanbacteria bacterium GW2011_GWB1_44_11c]OGH21201.1 MAG: hypothetical protein A2695_03650 [Candidatus Levybacteria bacterium RIFCSPHIGHO2_01_FULL_40_83]OGH25936.1 MAG: hypothetical protein A3D82_03225 [Candidatus Levybacteria
MDPECFDDAGVATLACIPSLLQNLIQFALVFAGIIALFLIIFSGIKFITSGGDPKQLESAKKTLTFAIGGLFLILLSFLIVSTIAQITGVDSIKKFGFPE